MQHLKIAGITIDIDGYELGGYFRSFEQTANSNAAELRAALTWERYPDLPDGDQLSRQGAQRWIHNHGETTYFRYDEDEALVAGLVYDAEQANYTLYARKDHVESADKVPELLENAMSRMLREAMIEQLSRRDGLMLHSACIEYGGRAFAFSARSGTGKSTHTNMWVEKLGAHVIDGDTSVIRANNGAPQLYGLPWCGTSGLYENTSAPLGAIVFLEQSPVNEVVELSPVECALRLAARCYMPHWAGYAAVDRAMGVVEQMVRSTRMCVLKCRPDTEAVEVVKRWLESNRGI